MKGTSSDDPFIPGEPEVPGSVCQLWHGRRLGLWFTIERGCRHLTVYQDRTCSGLSWNWRERFPTDSEAMSFVCGDEKMASRYVSKAVAAHTERTLVCEGSDPVLFKDRPAVQEFMTLMSNDDGSGRELSVLMIAVTANGIRVGIKDDQAGGWLWREAASFTKALNAIEECLASGNVIWSIPGGKGKSRK